MKTTTIKRWGVVQYNDLPFRILAALLSAHWLVAFGEPENTFELLALWYYYPALGGNFIMAAIIIEYIYQYTCFLDARFSWEHRFARRTFFQVIGGIGMPLLIDICLAAVYYWLHGISLTSANHFTYNLPLITLMITLLNAYYLIHYLMRVKYKRAPVHISVLEPSGAPTADASYPLLIVRINRECFQINAAGEMGHLQGTIEQIHLKLAPARYFQINRQCIVERSAVQKMRPWRSRVIKLELIANIHEDVFVSQRNAAAFKLWFLSGKK